MSFGPPDRLGVSDFSPVLTLTLVKSKEEPLNNSTWTKWKYFRRFFRKPHISSSCQC